MHNFEEVHKSPVRISCRTEVEILAAALKVQCQLGDLEFLNSILTLSSISYKLDQYYTQDDLVCFFSSNSIHTNGFRSYGNYSSFLVATSFSYFKCN